MGKSIPDTFDRSEDASICRRENSSQQSDLYLRPERSTRRSSIAIESEEVFDLAGVIHETFRQYLR
jgi:hypothetical protein